VECTRVHSNDRKLSRRNLGYRGGVRYELFFFYNIDIENRFIEALRNKYFIDKTLLIDRMNKLIIYIGKFVCITKPRRFGKSINALTNGIIFTQKNFLHLMIVKSFLNF